MTSVTAQEDSGEGVWSKILKTSDEYEKRITSTWNEDATGLLVFVSCIL